MLTLPVYIIIPTLYSQLGLGLAAIGTMLLAIRLIDAVSDPLIGILSDRISSPWGRRKPWLVLSMPVTALAGFQLFVPPGDVAVTYLVAWGLVLTFSWTAALIPYSAWAAELSGDYDERTRITAVRESFVLIGTLLATGLPALLTVFAFADLRQHAFAIAVCIVVLLPISVAIAAWQVPDPAPKRASRLGFGPGYRVLKENQAFRKLILAYLINATANGLPATLFILFVSFVLEMPESYGPLLFVYFLCGLAGIPIWARLAEKLGKHRAWSVAMLLACSAFVWTPFIVGAGDYWTFLIITVVSGFAVGADLAIPSSIQADVIDIDTAQTGIPRTGLSFALWGLATKGVLALAVGMAFPFRELSGFDATPGTAGNSDRTLFSLALLYAFVPVLLKLVAIALMWNFQVDKETQRGLQRQIADRTAPNA